MTSPDLHALAGAYVLDAVNDLERAAFTRHLGECDSCRVEVDELREAAARLADSTWSVPPPRLRGEVLAAIGRTRQLAPSDSTPAERDADTVPRWRRFAAGAVAASILAAGAGAVGWAVQEQRVRESRTIAADLAAQQQRTQGILAAADLQVKAAVLPDGGTVTVAMSPTHNAGVVAVGAKTGPPAGKAFQMWLIRGATATSVGVMAAGASSSMQVVEAMVGNDALGVTVEPAGGSLTPTLPIVAKVFLS